MDGWFASSSTVPEAMYVTGVLKCNSYLQNKCHSISLRIQLMAGHGTIEEERVEE